jgi:hypothetical protein
MKWAAVWELVTSGRSQGDIGNKELTKELEQVRKGGFPPAGPIL